MQIRRVSLQEIIKWSQFESFQKRNHDQQFEEQRIREIQRRRKYKEELDLLVEIKKKKGALRPSGSEKLEDIVEKNKQLDIIDQINANQMRDFERARLQESQVMRQKKLEEAVHVREAENSLILENLKNSCVRDEEVERLIRARKEQQNKSIKDFINYQVEQKHALKQQALQEDKKFSEEEQKEFEKFERNHKAYFDKIKSLGASKDTILKIFIQLQEEEKAKRKDIEFRMIDKPCLEKTVQEEQNYLIQQAHKKLITEQTNLGLSQQIENRRVHRENEEYARLKEEYESMVNELERQDKTTREYDQNRRQQLLKYLDSLKQQIEHNRNRPRDDHIMNPIETAINGVLGGTVKEVPGVEILGEGIPGINIPYDRKHQLELVDKNLKQTDEFLHKYIDGGVQFESSHAASRRKLASTVTYSRSLGINKENSSSLSSMNEYQYIRFRNKNSQYNPISHAPSPKFMASSLGNPVHEQALPHH